MNTTHYLIVGGGLTADAACKGIRDFDPSGAITVVGEEPHPPYARPPLSKALWKGEDETTIWRGTGDLDVELRLGRTIVALDLAARQATDDLGETYAYERLLLATGGRPRRLPFGDDEVIYFRTLDDYRRLRALADADTRFLVIGGGFIGSEIAAALTMNARSVTMVFPEEGIGARIFPSGLSQSVTDYYREQGVSVLAGTSVTAIERSGDKVLVTTGDGRTLEADAVVGGIGIEPRDELAAEAGLPVRDGIIVDDHGRAGGSRGRVRRRRRCPLPCRRARRLDARRARGSRKEPRPVGGREHGGRRRAVRPSALLLLRPLRSRLRGGRRAGQPAARRSPIGACRAERESSTTSTRATATRRPALESCLGASTRPAT